MPAPTRTMPRVPPSGPAEAARPAQTPRKPQAPKKPKAPAPRRRPGRFLRCLQVMLSVVVMIAVPLAALVLAYGYGNGEPLTVDATNLVRDIAELLGIRYE